MKVKNRGQHATLGYSHAFSNSRELSFAVMHALENSVSGGNPLEVPGQQMIELQMSQWEFSVGYSF